MRIRNRENFVGSVAEPLVTSPAVALWAMPVPARAIRSFLVPAMIALLDLRTEGGGTARADISECLALFWRQDISPAIQELLTVMTEDVGDFEPIFRYRLRPSPSDSVISMT